MFQKIGIALAAFEPNLDFFYTQLTSIQSQTHKHWICKICFDSPIGAILQDLRFKKIIEDPRFTFSENPSRLGHKKNFEAALKKVLKEPVDAIGFSDQDDIWFPNKLTDSLCVLNRLGKNSLVHCDMFSLIHSKGTDTGPRQTANTVWTIEQRGVHQVKPRHLLIRNVVAGCSLLMDADFARSYSNIPEGAKYHDHWFALVAAVNGHIEAIPQPLFSYRQHGINEVGVSPFIGRFKLPPQVSFLDIPKKCVAGWVLSHNLATSAASQGLKLTQIDRLLFLKNYDLGLGLFLLGIIQFFNDPPLARAAIAKSIGKMLSAFMVNDKHHLENARK